VTLVAHRDSTVDCERVPYAASRSDSSIDTARNSALLLRETLRRKPDVVQSFSRLAYLAPLLPLPVPKVMSYQRAVTPRSVRWGARAARGTLHFTGCSRQLIRDVASIGDWRVIHNAVPLSKYDFVSEVAPDAPLVFLGRIEEIKGAHVAIEVAKASGRTLVIAGNVDAAHRAYFTTRIAPHIDGKTVEYVGAVDDRAKNALLGSAAALLMPVLWEEPFGIVMAEALACAVPVIAFRGGSVAEVIEPGVTGFLDDDLAKAAMAALALNPEDCRAAALKYTWDACTRQFLNNLNPVQPARADQALDKAASG
jgi:glycosyltransferase involved in cell wall biosynthesis